MWRTELGDKEQFPKLVLELNWSLMDLVWRVEMREISGSDGFSRISFSGFASKLDGFVRFGCFVKI